MIRLVGWVFILLGCLLIWYGFIRALIAVVT